MKKANRTRPEGPVFETAPCARNDLTAPDLSCTFGIPHEVASEWLAAGPSFLAADPCPKHAEGLAALVAMRDSPDSAGEIGIGGIDVSVQLAVWAEVEGMSARLSHLLRSDPSDVARELGQSGGLIHEGLDGDSALRIAARLRQLPGLIVTLSDRATALYDIYLTRPLFDIEATRLNAMTGLIGTLPDALTEAVATGLDRRNRDVLLSRLPDLGLVAIDRAFQRFDLILTGATGWTTPELADFLVARTQRPRAAFETLSPDLPVKLDLGLRSNVARQFCADYAAIGLMVRPVLSSRGRNT